MRISVMQVGFAAAALAGLVLAFIGHPEPSDLPTTTPTSPNAPQTFALKSVSVELPTSEVVFPGPANATAITANCLSCHSAGMVLTQPNFSRAAWSGEVEKMIHTYKAPIAESDVTAIVDYLQATKGSK
jgi:hypothetical protein